MKKIFSLIFILCLAFTGVVFSACNDKDYLYKLDGIEIESVEIEKEDLSGDFILEIELENKTRQSKEFDFTLIKLKVDNNDAKLLDVIDLNKKTLNAKADKDFKFVLDEESINVYQVNVGSKVSVYYGNKLLKNVFVED